MQIRLAGVLATLIGFYLVATLSLRVHYSQKWWEKKVEAYSQIIEDLHKIYAFHTVFYDRRFDEYPNAEKWNNSTSGFTQAWDNLAKYVHLGDFIISNDVSEVLAEFDAGWYRIKDVEISFTDPKHAELTHKCLEKIKQLAKEDLQISKPKPFWKLF